MTKRKIIQISLSSRPESTHHRPQDLLVALCDDGTVFQSMIYRGEKKSPPTPWAQLPPIPQEKAE